MDFKLSKNSGDSQQEVPGEKKNQSALLVLLLILVGGFTYLYFFTGLIKPQEAQKGAESPLAAPQIVKIPLPVRGSEPAKPDGKAPEQGTVPKKAATPPAAATPPKLVPPPAKPAAVPIPVPAPAVKAVPAPPKPKEEPKKAEAVKPVNKKSPLPDTKEASNTITRSEEKKPAPEARKPTVAENKGASTKSSEKKPVSVTHPKPVTAAKTQKAATGPWVLVVGNYVLAEALSADMGRVRKAGFEPVITPSVHKNTAMNRLFVSEFDDRASAQPTLEKLKRYTSDAFVLEQNGRFSVYAGSYLQSDSATIEKERLKVAGFAVTVKHAEIAIPSQMLSIGPFTAQKAVDTALVTLKNAGIKATVTQK